MSEDPSVDKDKLLALHGDDYTNQLLKLRMDIDMHKDEDYEETKLEKVLRFTMKDELDAHDLKMIKAKRPHWIGVKPRVNTNRPKTKAERFLIKKKIIYEGRLKRRLNHCFIKRRNKDRIHTRMKRLNKNFEDLVDEYEQ